MTEAEPRSTVRGTTASLNSTGDVLIPMLDRGELNDDSVEEVIARELPLIQENAEKVSGTKVNRLRYRGVTKINDTGMSLSFVVFCPGYCFVRVLTAMNRELKLMFDRNNIRIALPQVEVHGLTTETHGLQS